MAPVPLSPHRFQILLALASGPLHGSGIARVVLDQTGGALRLWPVTLYSTLEQLAAEGWLREDERARPAGGSERLRHYRLTPVGRRALAAEADRLAALADTARARLADERP